MDYQIVKRSYMKAPTILADRYHKTITNASAHSHLLLFNPMNSTISRPLDGDNDLGCLQLFSGLIAIYPVA